MNRRIHLLGLTAIAIVVIGVSSAQAGGLFARFGGAGCCEPACCEPACCEPAACEPACCEPAACEPACCEPACCDPCGGKGGCGLFAGLRARLAAKKAAKCCEPACCEPAA